MKDQIANAKKHTSGSHGDPAILTFIQEFVYGKDELAAGHAVDPGSLIRQFNIDYSWHFAHILKNVFGNDSGEVYLCPPLKQFTFGRMYKKNMCYYNINGLFAKNAQNCYIPEDYLGPAIVDYTHRPDDRYDITRKELNAIIEKFNADVEKRKKNIHEILNKNSQQRFEYDPKSNMLIDKTTINEYNRIMQYIPIDDTMRYMYCPTNNTIYATNSIDKGYLIDLYALFCDDENYVKYPLAERLRICKKLIWAYELGCGETQRKFRNHIHDAVSKCIAADDT